MATAPVSNSITNGVSIWLTFGGPENASQHQKIIDGLSQAHRGSIYAQNDAESGPLFQPHVTLLYLPLTKLEEIEQVIEITKQLASGFKGKALNVPVKAFASKNTFYRNCLVELELIDELAKLHKSALEKYDGFYGKTEPFYPHMSLFYGKPDNKIILKEAEKRSKKLIGQNLRLTSLSVYYTEGFGPADWIHLGDAPLGGDMFYRSSLFIGNQWRNPKEGQFRKTFNPATKEVLHHYPNATSQDVDDAVRSSHKAFQKWSQTTGAERAKYLNAIADAVDKRADYLARLETLNNGKPLPESKFDVGDVAGCFRFHANLAIELDKKQGTNVEVADKSYTSQLRYEPVGVCGMIIPWNYPLLMLAWKLAPLLAAGCTGVLKPSELTPLTALEFGTILQAAKLPEGVVNIVTGEGPDAGEPLVKHPLISKVAFTGSVITGSKINILCAPEMKRCSLELGGKSPFIVFDDIPSIGQVVEWIMFGIFFNQGQVCSATSRVLLHESIYEKVKERLVAEAKKLKLGNGLEAEVKMGPIVSKRQFEKISNYIKLGQKEGATLVCGGIPEANSPLASGWFVQPTIFENVTDNMTIWKEEIFGPVLCLRKFKTEDEAIALANDTSFGLAGAVITKNEERLNRVGRQLQAGIIWQNCSQPTFVEAPWGGYKKSGIGRELGEFGIKNYLEVKQVTTYKDAGGFGFGWYVTSK